MNNLYHHGQAQLQTTLARLQSTQSQLHHTHIQNTEIQKELDRERGACELVHQQLLELEQNYGNLQKDQEEAVALQAQLTKSVEEYQSYAQEVARQAEEIINDLRTGSAEREVGEKPNGQSISAMIMQSAKNALLVEATARGYSETDILHRLKNVIDQNAEFQLQIESLSETLGARDGELEARNKEIASLNKALELTAEGGKQTRTRRGGKQRKFIPRIDSV